LIHFYKRLPQTRLKMPKIPRLEKFCFCMDVHGGVRAVSIGLMVLWVLRTLVAIFGSNSGNYIWTIILSLINVAAFFLVLYGMRKPDNRFLIPAMVICIFDVVEEIIAAIVYFAKLWWGSAIVCLIIVAIVIYYLLGLKTVYDDISSAGPPAAAAPTETKPAATVNPV